MSAYIYIYATIVGSHFAYKGFKLAFFTWSPDFRDFYVGWPIGITGLLAAVFSILEILIWMI